MAKPQANRLLVMRTGATSWDRDERLQGSSDLPLTEQGRDAAAQAVGDLGKPEMAVVFCAPDEASMETAKLLAAAAGCKAIPVEDLAELHLGLWEGLRRAELEGRYSRAGRQWLDDPASINAPEGEPFSVFEHRVLSAIRGCLMRMKSEAPIGLVLRSISAGLVRCRLNDSPTSMLWSMLGDRPAAEWYELERDDLRLTSRDFGKTATAA